MFANASHNSRISIVPPVPGRIELLTRVTELIAELKPDDVDLLKALHRINHEYRYIPPAAIPLLAAQFETTPAIIYGTIDYYAELQLRPPAENVVEWCSGPACLLKNSMGIRRALEAEFGCLMREASIDGKYELRLVQCDGTCHLAPLIRHKGRYIGPLTTSQAIEFARDLKGSAEPGTPHVKSIPAEPVAEVPPPGAAAGQKATSGQTAKPVRGPRPPAEPGQDPTREPGE